MDTNDIVNCFEQLHELIEEVESQNEDKDTSEFIPLSEALKDGRKRKKAGKSKKAEDIQEKIKVYSFVSLNPIIRAAHLVASSYTAKNTIWKNTETGRYYLLLNRGNAKKAFRSVCSVIGEFGKEEPITYATQDYFNEHYQIIVKDKALTQLAQL